MAVVADTYVYTWNIQDCQRNTTQYEYTEVQNPRHMH